MHARYSDRVRPRHYVVFSGVVALSLVAVSGVDLAFGLAGIAVAFCWLALFVYFLNVEGDRGSLTVIAGSLAVLALGVTGIPATARLELSKGYIEEAGRAVLRGDEPHWAGLYGVNASWVSPDGCAILVTHSVVIDDAGFAYCPNGVSSPGGPHMYSDVYEYSS